MWQIILAVILVASVNAGKLPSYITQCNKSALNLDECLIEVANLAIPLLAKGDKHYGIPEMSPLKMSYAILNYDKDLKFILRDVEVNGIDTAKVTKLKLDENGEDSEFEFHIPRLEVLSSNYELGGRLVNISMYGSGFANITLIDGVYKYYPKFEPRTHEFGDLYVFGESSMIYETNRTIYNIEGLTNVNEFIGLDLNVVLNEYWKEVAEVLRPGASKIMADFIASIFKNMFRIVSADELYKQ